MAKPVITAAEALTNQNINYNDMVDAFTDALSGVKVVLDDDQMGYFVRKTVTDAIYV
jgi:hypothetical protein